MQVVSSITMLSRAALLIALPLLTRLVARSVNNCATGQSLDNSAPGDGCVDCPLPGRCLGHGFCANLSRGNLCSSCQDGYYTAGETCARCPDHPWIMGAIIIVVLVIVTTVIWKVSKPEPYEMTARGLTKERHAVYQSTAAARTNTAVVAQTATTMRRTAYTLVASIVWPHFT